MAITVALTNYNAADHLSRILPQLRAQGFNDVVVLDDASTDGSVSFLREQADIKLVTGTENLGPTGNKNRILEVDSGDIILFLDVDMEPTGQDMAAILEREFADNPEAAVIGGLVLTALDEPICFNWGYEGSPFLEGVRFALTAIAEAHGQDPAVMATVRQLAAKRVGYLEPLENRDVDVVMEAFFAIRADVFRELGGFDPGFRRYHEGPDLCRRVRQAGHKVHFSTNMTARHLNLASGSSEERANDMLLSTYYYAYKHYGMKPWQLDQMYLGR